MIENVSVISECDNLEIENYLKSCGNYPKNTEVKFVGGHGNCGAGPSTSSVCSLIQYSKCVINKVRNDLRDSELPDIDKHIIIEKERLNDLLKSKIKEFIRDYPVREKTPSEQIQPPLKIVHFNGKSKPLVLNGRNIKFVDRHVNCIGNNKAATKPGFVSRKSQQIHENKIKSLRLGRNIVVDPTPVTSYYPRRIFNDIIPESAERYRPTWHDMLTGPQNASSNDNCTIVTKTTSSSQVIKKSEIKILRYNFDWGGTDAVSNEKTGGRIQNIDQTTQTDSNVVTMESVQCFTEQLGKIDVVPKIREQSPIIEPSSVRASSTETDEHIQVTVESSFVYEYESTFDDSNSDSEASETVRPNHNAELVPIPVSAPRKPNILLESVVHEEKKLDHCDAEVHTGFEPVLPIAASKNIQNSSSDMGDEPPKGVELELSRLEEEIMQDKFKLLSVLRHSSQDTRINSNTSRVTELFSRHRDLNGSQPSCDNQLQLTPLKPRNAAEFIPSPLELSSIRPIALTHKNMTFDLSDEKCWKTINKIQMDAVQKPFSPPKETDDAAKRAAEKFLKSTVAVTNTHRAIEPEPNLTATSSYVSDVIIVTTSSSEYESDSTFTSSQSYAQFRKYTNSGKISEGEVLSLGEVRKSGDDSG